MLAEFIFIDNPGVIMFSVLAVSFILSVFGFIGNININSGDGNVNISGQNIDYQEQDSVDESIDASGASGININNPVGSVNLSVTGEDKVLVTKKLFLPNATPEEEKKQLKQAFKSSFLAKNANAVDLVIPKMVVLGGLSARVDLDIKVPERFNLKQLPGTNDISIESISGKVELENNAGKINLANLSGEVYASSNSGALTGNKLTNPVSITVNAGNISFGSLSLKSKDAKIKANAGGVEVDIDQVAPDARCKVEVNSGDILISINRQANVTIEAKSNMGDVVLDPDIKVISGGKNFMGASYTAQVNNGGGNILASSATGMIKIILK
jgi:hypothetical protein